MTEDEEIDGGGDECAAEVEQKNGTHQPENASPTIRMAMWRYHRRMAARRDKERNHEQADFHMSEARRWIRTPPAERAPLSVPLRIPSEGRLLPDLERLRQRIGK